MERLIKVSGAYWHFGICLLIRYRTNPVCQERHVIYNVMNKILSLVPPKRVEPPEVLRLRDGNGSSAPGRERPKRQSSSSVLASTRGASARTSR